MTETSGGHHTDAGVAVLAKRIVADHVWIAAEMSFPQCVTYNDAI